MENGEWGMENVEWKMGKYFFVMIIDNYGIFKRYMAK